MSAEKGSAFLRKKRPARGGTERKRRPPLVPGLRRCSNAACARHAEAGQASGAERNRSTAAAKPCGSAKAETCPTRSNLTAVARG